jgi:nucleoid-associated protein YgaU
MEIFNANTDVLTDPNKIKPGQVLKIPQTARH